MAFPCPLCGAVSRVRTSRMLTATAKEIYYNCSNNDCCHQYEPRTVAQPIKGGALIPPERLRALSSLAKPSPPPALTVQAGRIQHRVLK
ncbi:ogr/Delta-like zinc finger family protein [Chromobacterium vaccinii]|uniref:Zinc finger Ogr/Delta-type domain-containing protein n=1 Tax=Chromobacterium vaccinii TaxID=1108595 RepID=A0A1D9LHC1_9NEIS|nr:ogr/Delta-like zinc finger family protein [Chromobacterium vaccinii]AOZ50662.1 hypothetical protein BKX93_12130 [Chromobacterium vaccinii]